VFKRSSLLVVIGAAVFVLGAGVVLMSLHAANRSAHSKELSSPGATRPTAVVVATKDLSAGQTGESILAGKDVELEAVPTAELSAADLTSLSALDQETLNRPVVSGQPITATDLSVDAGVLAPPKGEESIALTLPNGASGLAGYLQPGQKVDVYADVTHAASSSGKALVTPCVTLVQSKVQVLDVSSAVPAYVSDPTSAGRSVPGTMTVLVAATPREALNLIYYTTNEQLYLTESAQSHAAADGSCLTVGSTTTLVPAS